MIVNDLPKSLMALYLILILVLVYSIFMCPISLIKRV